MVTDVYGMKTEKQFVNTLQDIIQHCGAPTKLISDHDNLETSSKVKDILRYLMIPNCQSEPYCQHQNPAERQYFTIKETTNRIMDWTGTPAFLWLEALKYTCYLLNHTICQSLDAIPMQLLTGSTPDISTLLQFHWYQYVYCAKDDASFPSNSHEISGRFIGFADHVGHNLTYAILTNDTQCIIHRSRVRTAEDPKTINICANKWGENQEPHEFISTHIDDKPNNEDQVNANNQIPTTNTEDLVGRTYPIIDNNGNEDKITIVDVLEKHETDTISDPSHIEFPIKNTRDDYEGIMAYNNIINTIQDYKENNIL